MEFGIFHEFPSLPERRDAEAFAQSFALVDDAERWGLDVMWLAELHFDVPRSVLSAPLCVASAIAARTRRMKIGIAVQVLPLCHPLRLAEETATLDQISEGRLILGVGRSGVARTYAAYGVPYAESRERFDEVLDIVQRAWTQPDLSYRGKHYEFENVTVTPLPYQRPMPPIRIAASSPETCATIGRLGYPIFVGIRYEDAAHLAPQIRSYREAWQAAGHPGNGQVFLRCPVYLADTAEAARTEGEASLMHYYRQQAALLQDSADLAGAPPTDPRAVQARRLNAITYEEALRGLVLFGTPAEIAERLAGVQAELGLDGVLAELDTGGQIPHARVRNALRLLCQEVMPRFR